MISMYRPWSSFHAKVQLHSVRFSIPWRIVHATGSKITRLNPMQGFCAETGGALTLLGVTWPDIPFSTHIWRATLLLSGDTPRRCDHFQP
ncbi:hypothetical protein BS630_07960 [Rhizobium laguerreae]|nr:hypothetical protein BS630_07960 [Rhizobium laguerreae]